jgi:dsRNA-specific ribonuclease
MLSCDEQKGIYLGSRGSDFKDLISSLLRKGGLKTKYINMLTDYESMKVFGCAFTSELVDADNNYQVLEQLGDLSGNKFIVNYMYQRFPQLDCADGVKVVARLRINYGATASFCEIARKLGFWPFISATNELRMRKMKPLLEDVFEAFLGATERLLDKHKRVGVGYAIVHDILTSLFDEMDISLRYEDLYDSKTRLKELFDTHEQSIGSLIYKEQKNEQITFSTAYRLQGSNHIKIGEGSAALKADAQQSAASSALITLNKQGWFKNVPAIYKKFNNCADKDNDLLTYENIKQLWGNDINSLHTTKDKSKYQSKYKSTPIAMYCRLRNTSAIEHCLSLDADPNITDTDGMYPIDLLFIGKTDETLLENIIQKLLKKGNLNMTQQVFDVYFTNYINKYFGTITSRIVLV